MKRKNVKVGQFIIAKNTHGGGAGHLLTTGVAYKVRTIERSDYSGRLYCQIHLKDNPEQDTLWVDPKHFRKSTVISVNDYPEATVKATITDVPVSIFTAKPKLPEAPVAPARRYKFKTDDIVELTKKCKAYHGEVINQGLYRVKFVDNIWGVTMCTVQGGFHQASLPEDVLTKVGEYARI